MAAGLQTAAVANRSGARLFATRLLRQIASVIQLPDIAATQALAGRIAALARPGDAILLEGELGAGKTEFARAFIRAAADQPTLEVPSPTFTLVQSYDVPVGLLHHFDLWRLSGPSDLSELGWDEAREGIVLVEWPERLGGQRPADALTIALRITGATSRCAMLSGWPDRIA